MEGTWLRQDNMQLSYQVGDADSDVSAATVGTLVSNLWPANCRR